MEDNIRVKVSVRIPSKSHEKNERRLLVLDFDAGFCRRGVIRIAELSQMKLNIMDKQESLWPAPT
jgi:hypothetical protein